ncbi:hypothetical protein G7046_g8916 [Stylonectria norvegica]|nr:hypothetical protein G7046_g8916 [Stylonectria norvegica]
MPSRTCANRWRAYALPTMACTPLLRWWRHLSTQLDSNKTHSDELSHICNGREELRLAAAGMTSAMESPLALAGVPMDVCRPESAADADTDAAAEDASRGTSPVLPISLPIVDINCGSRAVIRRRERSKVANNGRRSRLTGGNSNWRGTMGTLKPFASLISNNRGSASTSTILGHQAPSLSRLRQPLTTKFLRRQQQGQGRAKVSRVGFGRGGASRPGRGPPKAMARGTRRGSLVSLQLQTQTQTQRRIRGHASEAMAMR